MELLKKNDQLIFDPQCDKNYLIKNINVDEYKCANGEIVLENNSLHPLYEVIIDDKKEIIGQQLISDVDIMNFRDLGGYRNEDGKQVKYHCFYRSSPIVFKDELSREKYKELGIQAILDFRGIEEANNRPDEIMDSEYYHICAIDDQEFNGSLDVFELFKNNEMEALHTYMQRIYTIIPFHNPAYQKLFDLMLEGKSVVFHCSAGKDRTGFAAYLILRTLGVSHENCLNDYLLSNTYLGENNVKLAKSFGHDELANDLFFVSERNLNFSINAIYEKYGDFMTYIKEEYGIDEEKVKKLRGMYLYD